MIFVVPFGKCVRRLSPLILMWNIYVFAQQAFHHLVVALLNSVVDRRLPISINSIKIWSVAQKLLCDFDIAFSDTVENRILTIYV